jgi:Ca2+-binding EF-hand superfamily protein
MRWTLAILPFLVAGAAQAAEPAPAMAPMADQSRMHDPMPAQGNERWKAADKDGNGALSRTEAEASMPHLAQKFDQVDANHDGQVSHDEMRAFHAGQKQHSPEEMQAHFKAADKNGDGAIDLAEAKAGMPKLADHFADVDLNKDGKVTMEEMKAHHEHMEAMRGQQAPPPPAAH